jgi:biopolymer transport protein ExbD
MNLFGMPERRRAKNRDAEISVINLIDVIFVLLVFFVMTTTFSRETGVEVTKPNAQSASQVKKENVMIAITREGTIHVNERQVDLAGLKDVLKNIVQKNPETEVVLMADKAANTGTLVSVIDAANLSGSKKVSIAALSE